MVLRPYIEVSPAGERPCKCFQAELAQAKSKLETRIIVARQNLQGAGLTLADDLASETGDFAIVVGCDWGIGQAFDSDERGA